MRLVPRLHERANQSIPIIYGTFLGPVLIALWGLLGRRWLKRTGLFFSLGATATMANIGASRVVPGANDNLSSVGVLVALAHELSERPPEGVRVILLSTGSEEGFMEGMQAFGRRHFGELDRGHDRVRLPGVRRARLTCASSRPRGCCGCATTPSPHARRWLVPARRPASS